MPATICNQHGAIARSDRPVNCHLCEARAKIEELKKTNEALGRRLMQYTERFGSLEQDWEEDGAWEDD